MKDLIVFSTVYQRLPANRPRVCNEWGHTVYSGRLGDFITATSHYQATYKRGNF